MKSMESANRTDIRNILIMLYKLYTSDNKTKETLITGGYCKAGDIQLTN